MMAPKSAIVPAAITSWPNVRDISPASLSTETITPSDVAESMIATNSGVHDQAGALERERQSDRDRKRDGIADPAKPQHAPAQTLEIDLEAGEEQQEGEADEREHLDRSSTSTQPSPDGPDDDPGHELEHHSGQPHAREQPQQRTAPRRPDDDDQQGGEGRLSHGLTQSRLGAERYARYSPDELHSGGS